MQRKTLVKKTSKAAVYCSKLLYGYSVWKPTSSAERSTRVLHTTTCMHVIHFIIFWDSTLLMGWCWLFLFFRGKHNKWKWQKKKEKGRRWKQSGWCGKLQAKKRKMWVQDAFKCPPLTTVEVRCCVLWRLAFSVSSFCALILIKAETVFISYYYRQTHTHTPCISSLFMRLHCSICSRETQNTFFLAFCFFILAAWFGHSVAYYHWYLYA